MQARIIPLLLVASALIGLILYSQYRPQSNFVSGIVETDEIRLGSRVGGRVKAVHVNEGDSVVAGQSLIEFEPFDLAEREQQARAELAQREAALQKMQAGLRDEEIAQAEARFQQAAAELSLRTEGPRAEEIAAAQQRLAAAESELQLAEREFKRVAGLNQNNAISKSEFDKADEQSKRARAQVVVRQNELKIFQAGSRQQEIEQAQARVDELRSAWELAQKGYRDEDIAQARAARAAAAAALEVIRQQKQELTLTAPSSGVIDSLDLQPGDLVAPNAPVVTMLSRDRFWIRAYVPQRFLKIRVGQKLKVTLDSFPNEEFVGETTYVSSQAEFTPSNVQTPDDRAKLVYRIRVRLDSNDNRRLRAGMTANVWLPTDAADPISAPTSDLDHE